MTYKYTTQENTIISNAIKILKHRVCDSELMNSTKDVKQYCQLAIANEPDEWFCCMFLNNQHQLITFEKLFRGTVDHANVHPRVILRRALELNSAALIFAHNHPSGSTTPSASDIHITKKLTTLLSEIDVRVLDHLIVTTSTVVSMADLGLITNN